MDPNFNLPLPLHTLATLGFYFMAMGYIIFSAVLHYHWTAYAVEEGVTRTTLILYYCSTIPLMIILGVTALVI